jgi:chromate transporter
MKWILLNLKIGAISIGGGGRIMLYREVAVEQEKWLTKEEFQEAVTIAQLLPGPNFVNFVIYAGYRLTSMRTGILAVLCLGIPGAIAAVFLHKIFNFDNLWVKWLFTGFSIGSVIAFAILVWSLIKGLSSTIDPKASASYKVIATRYFLGGCVSLGVFAGVSLPMLLAVAAPACILTEFLFSESRKSIEKT